MRSPDTVDVHALFISDVHLGTRGCQADLLLDFLARYRADRIYLVGDIIDGWRLSSRWYWPDAHDEVIAAFIARARAGARVIYMPGNHDAFLRGALGTSFSGMPLVDRMVHHAADGKRYLVLHGDQFDVVGQHARWLARCGDVAYRTMLAANTSFNRVRQRRGLPYWSLSAWAKLKVKEAVNYIGDFETQVSAEARKFDVDGVICGHIHHAAMHNDYGINYINTGDWVESCTAAVEHLDGQFEIVRWAEVQRRAAARAARASRPVPAPVPAFDLTEPTVAPADLAPGLPMAQNRG